MCQVLHVRCTRLLLRERRTENSQTVTVVFRALYMYWPTPGHRDTTANTTVLPFRGRPRSHWLFLCVPTDRSTDQHANGPPCFAHRARNPYHLQEPSDRSCTSVFTHRRKMYTSRGFPPRRARTTRNVASTRPVFASAPSGDPGVCRFEQSATQRCGGAIHT